MHDPGEDSGHAELEKKRAGESFCVLCRRCFHVPASDKVGENKWIDNTWQN